MAMKATLVAALIFAVAVTMMSVQVEGLTCGQVAGNLGSCIDFLKSGGTPTAACCKGVAALKNLAQTKDDKQTACKCIKSTASSINGINYANAAALPGLCKVSIPYKIAPSTNCNSIS